MNYQPQDITIMKNEAKSNKKSRLQELIDFAKLSGFKKLGIANCLSMQKYADKLAELLRMEGFEVLTVNCKESKLEASELSAELKGPSCDPVYQADILNNAQTDFNIEVGLCLGHGLLFRKYSKALVTTFIIKDFAHKHNVLESLL